MTKRRSMYGFMAVVVMGLAGGLGGIQVSQADDEKKKGAGAGKEGDHQAMMAAYEKAGEPAEQHKHLTKMAGKWNLAFKSWMAPNQPPMETTGTATAKAILGDRFVQMDVTSTMMGKPFTGISLTGYDKTKKKYVGTWIDSMSTGMMRMEGTADAAGKVFTNQGVGTDPITGKDSKMKIVSKWESDDKFVDEFFERKGGKEVKTMEITYTRAK